MLSGLQDLRTLHHLALGRQTSERVVEAPATTKTGLDRVATPISGLRYPGRPVGGTKRRREATTLLSRHPQLELWLNLE